MHRTFLILFAFTAVLFGESPEPAWELVHPDAKLLVGIEVRNLGASPTIQFLRSQIADQVSQITKQINSQPMTGTFLKSSAWQLLTDIDRVLISTPSDLNSSASAAAAIGSMQPPPKDKRNPPFLVILEGEFPAEHLRLLTSSKHYAFRGSEIYFNPVKKNDAFVAVLNNKTVLFGDQKSVQGAIERSGHEPLKSRLVDRAKTLAASNDIWIVATALRSEPSSGLPFASFQIDSADIALNLHQGLSLDLGLDADSESTAHSLEQAVSSQLQFLTATQQNNPDAADLMRRLEIHTEGNRVQFHVAMTEEELEKQIRNAQAMRLAAGSPGSNSFPKPEPQPQGPRTVKIFGLDDGVREIPFGSPNK